MHHCIAVPKCRVIEEEAGRLVGVRQRKVTHGCTEGKWDRGADREAERRSCGCPKQLRVHQKNQSVLFVEKVIN